MRDGCAISGTSMAASNRKLIIDLVGCIPDTSVDPIECRQQAAYGNDIFYILELIEYLSIGYLELTYGEYFDVLS
jgi:hypothetical protein